LIIAGIDPGSNITGYAFLNVYQDRLKVLEYGVIRSKSNWTLPEKLSHIYGSLTKLMEQYSPDGVAMETAFFAKYPSAALVLGHVRGAIMTAASNLKIPIYEYEPKVVKKSVVGGGSASKQQVAKMVQKLLNLSKLPTPTDAADALAVCYCHTLRSR